MAETSSLEVALGQFDATEANLKKLEELWSKITSLIPGGPAFGAPDGYDDACRAFRRVLKAMPAIDGIRIEDCLLEYDAIGQLRLDCLELGEFDCTASSEREIVKQGTSLAEYRFTFTNKRRELVRSRMLQLIESHWATRMETTAGIVGRDRNLVWFNSKSKEMEVE
jgi:hypothetical protein